MKNFLFPKGANVCMDMVLRSMDACDVVAVSGRMDAVTAPEFEKQCLAWMEEGHTNFLLDFSSLEYISSAGLRSILGVAKKVKPLGGKVVLAGLTGVVAEVFSISGFDAFLPIVENVETGKEVF